MTPARLSQAKEGPVRRSHAQRDEGGFTSLELVVAILLFGVATGSVLVVSRALANHRTAAAAASQQNAYATFQAQVALQGINPALVGNPLQAVIARPGTVGTVVPLGTNTPLTVTRGALAGFEVGAVAQPPGARRNLPGSAQVNAISYLAAPGGVQTARGLGLGFAIATTGTAPVNPAMPLAPPAFNVVGDLTYAAFPLALNQVVTLPATNPPGTTYHYTTDGSAPTAASPVWSNAGPAWTAASFPGQLALAAFNTDPQYAPSVAVTAAYSMQIIVSYGRADGRTSNVYGFTLADLAIPADTGIVLTENVPGPALLYTLDGSDPTVAGLTYEGAFAPLADQFSPSSVLKVAAVSSDPRYVAAGVSTYPLTSVSAPLTAPSFVTSNASPLAPGTPVVISVGSSGSPRTEVNNGAPQSSSSDATSFPLN